MTMPHRWPSLGVPYVPAPIAPSHRGFGLTVGSVFVAIALFSAWRGHATRADIIGSTGLILIVLGLVRPAWLGGLAAAWGRVGHALGWFNSRVLLSLVFFVVFLPIGVIGRLFGSDPLDVRRRARSFWIDYSARMRDPKHFDHLF